MKRILFGPILVLCGAITPCGATMVSLYSGTFDGEGDHPAPVLVGKVMRGERYLIEVGKVSALVNYPEPEQPVITERVITQEIGATVTCPWYLRMDTAPLGTRVNEPYTVKTDNRIVCDDGTCKDMVGRAVKPEDLLFGKYYLPKYKTNDGKDFGLAATLWVQGPPPADCKPTQAVPWCMPKVETFPIACQEFSVERTFSELHYFDRLLVIENFRQQLLTDLDVDFRKLYLTFENERAERTNCVLTDLVEPNTDIVRIDDLRDCVLPAGQQLTMYAQSRFFQKDTRACGKFVAKGVKMPDGSYSADWFLGWYECDGKQGRTPVEKQFTYATTVELSFTKQGLSGGGTQ